jgi:hypothetical protein
LHGGQLLNPPRENTFYVRPVTGGTVPMKQSSGSGVLFGTGCHMREQEHRKNGNNKVEVNSHFSIKCNLQAYVIQFL